MAGNSKRVESTNLISLIPHQQLRQQSLKRFVCSRHLVNASFILHPNEYTLLNFLIFMNEGNVVKYSTKLLKQYDAASSRMIQITGATKVNYSTSRDIARNSFIGLIEKGYLIRIRKNDFMLNPMVFIPNHITNPMELQKQYLEACESDNVQESLSKMCNKLVNK